MQADKSIAVDQVSPNA